MIRRWAVLAASYAAFISCSDPVGPPRDDSPLQTDQTAYRLHRNGEQLDAEAVVTITNSSLNDIHYARCGGFGPDEKPMFAVFRNAPDETRSEVGVSYGCSGGVPSGRIAPGETVEATVWLGSHDSPNANPPVLMEHRIGIFRIRARFCEEAVEESGDCVDTPLETRQSNAFEILPPS